MGQAEALRALEPGRFVTIESRLPTGGSLQARKDATGAISLFWRYSHQGKTSRESIGTYDPASPPKKREPTAKGYGIAAARERCAELAAVHAKHRNVGGLKEAKRQERQQLEAAKAAEAAKSERTLARLLETYVAHLKAQGRHSYVKAKGLFALHVTPHESAIPAADVTAENIIDMQRRLIEQGKGRTANKLRSYIGAAYQCALKVRKSASVPLAFKAFNITVNPVALTERSTEFDRADKRPLSADELRTYWRIVRELSGVPGAALRLHLLTGGQRIEQLLRLRWSDVASDGITIFDVKGRPGHGPRPHCLPLLAAAVDALRELPREGEFVISSTHGRRPVSASTFSSWAREAVGDAIEGFQLKRVRSGVETLLAASGVSREIRGHLQSHGLTGVQARHYDAHDYMPEKRAALDVLMAALERRDGGGEVLAFPNKAA